MRLKSLAMACAFALLLGSSNATAGTILIMVGDNDGFGFGDANVPDGSNLLNINQPEDRRSASEAAATDGTQQTDFYTALSAPLPSSFDIVFDLSGVTLSNATLEVDMGGFQASLGQLTVSYNGVVQTNLWDNIQDGAYATAVRQFVLSPTDIANSNAAGEFRVTVSRGSSSDAIAFDYFALTGTAVPEPGVVALLGIGLAGLGFATRRSA